MYDVLCAVCLSDPEGRVNLGFDGYEYYCRL